MSMSLQITLKLYVLKTLYMAAITNKAVYNIVAALLYVSTYNIIHLLILNANAIFQLVCHNSH